MSVDSSQTVVISEPSIDPRGLGFSGVLTDIFGLPSTLDRPTQEAIDRRNTLARLDVLTPELATEFEELNSKLRTLGFLYEDRDKLYGEFLRQLDSVALADVKPLTPEQLSERDTETKNIVDRILSKQ